MVLVVGATGQLGDRIARAMLAAGETVRVLVRHPERAAELAGLGAEVVEGDLLAPATVALAVAGCDEVLTTANGGGLPPGRRVVDQEGNANLIDAARAAGVRRLLFVSARSAAPDSPVDLFRWKWETEERLRASGLDHTILRPTHLLDTWIELVGPGARSGRVMLFGRAANPVSFVAAADVTRVAVAALRDPRASRRTLEVGGPRALSLGQLTDHLEVVLGRPVRRRHLPLGALRAAGRLLRPWRPVLARQLAFAVLLESADQVSRDDAIWELFPGPRTDPAQYVRDWLAARPAGRRRAPGPAAGGDQVGST